MLTRRSLTHYQTLTEHHQAAGTAPGPRRAGSCAARATATSPPHTSPPELTPTSQTPSAGPHAKASSEQLGRGGIIPRIRKERKAPQFFFFWWHKPKPDMENMRKEILNKIFLKIQQGFKKTGYHILYQEWKDGLTLGEKLYMFWKHINVTVHISSSFLMSVAEYSSV